MTWRGNRSRSRSSPWAARAAACSPTGSSTWAKQTATSRRPPRCPASRSAPARRSTTSSCTRGTRPSATAPTPVLALMPLPGDVDVVLASELMEAGRAVQRGLVTPDRTTLIASTHRVYSIAEKTRARRRPRRQRRAARARARGGEALRPLRHGRGGRASGQRDQRGAVRRARRHRRAAVRARPVRGDDRARRRRRRPSLKAFDAAYARAPAATMRRAAVEGARSPAPTPARPRRAASERARRYDRRAVRRGARRRHPATSIRAFARCSSASTSTFRAAARAVLREGVRRLIDYQDPPTPGSISTAWRASRPRPHDDADCCCGDRAPSGAVDELRGHDARRRS